MIKRTILVTVGMVSAIFIICFIFAWLTKNERVTRHYTIEVVYAIGQRDTIEIDHCGYERWISLDDGDLKYMVHRRAHIEDRVAASYVRSFKILRTPMERVK